MTVDGRLISATSGAAIFAVVSAALDLRGAPAGLVLLVFMLLGPGYAFSLLMGPMRPEVRLLTSLVGSISFGTAISLVMVTTGTWSVPLGLATLAIITQVCVIVTLRRGPFPLANKHGSASTEGGAPNAAILPTERGTT